MIEFRDEKGRAEEDTEGSPARPADGDLGLSSWGNDQLGSQSSSSASYSSKSDYSSGSSSSTDDEVEISCGAAAGAPAATSSPARKGASSAKKSVTSYAAVPSSKNPCTAFKFPR
jgi:hypothetical protein